MTDDTISRKMAIDVIDKIFPADPMRNDYTKGITCGAALAKTYVEQLPSAQPERLTDDDFETIRIHLNAYKEKLCNQQRWGEGGKMSRRSLPVVWSPLQNEQTASGLHCLRKRKQWQQPKHLN